MQPNKLYLPHARTLLLFALSTQWLKSANQDEPATSAEACKDTLPYKCRASWPKILSIYTHVRVPSTRRLLAVLMEQMREVNVVKNCRKSNKRSLSARVKTPTSIPLAGFEQWLSLQQCCKELVGRDLDGGADGVLVHSN